ncbi:MAG: D-aminoacyl-tRNA deacylase, partial [Corynebacterium casei]|nr:D-aminoacyl-tRNA deacylase [Corynebacterium casei]
MRAVLTRCLSASVTVDDEVVGSFDAPETGGLLALIGV